MLKSFYITTTIPYVNSDPHIGFALELVQSDAMARYKRLSGFEVFFSTGTDEHGQKIWEASQKEGKKIKAYVDYYSGQFQKLKGSLAISNDAFVRTTSEHHIKAAQEMWKRCEASGDIYKKSYTGKYCVGCESFKMEKDLSPEGRCLLHPNMEVRVLSEENYFFRLSKYQKRLLQYLSSSQVILPDWRRDEAIAFVQGGLEDFSISREKERLGWGVPVSNDSSQVMYVWFDALVNYISVIGWPTDMKQFGEWWPAVQICGKDNLRQQSAMWQAMLMSAGISTSKQIFIHGFITAEGQKMSKSLGNVVNPYELVKIYGTDPVRHFLLGAVPAYEDGDFSIVRFEEWYTAHMANGIGNLTSRILTMIEKYCGGMVPKKSPDCFETKMFWKQYAASLTNYHFDELIAFVHRYVILCDEKISAEKPWEKVKKGEDVQPLLYQLAEGLRQIAVALLPIIPHTAETMLKQLGTEERSSAWGKLKKGDKIQKGEPLFPRLINNQQNFTLNALR